MKLPKFTVFGNRVSIIEIDEPVTGVLELPQTRQRSETQIGEINAVGSDVKAGLRVGDRVLFQIPDMVKRTAAYSYPSVNEGPNQFAIAHAGDVFGVLSRLEFTIDAFTITGDWVLCKPMVMKDESDIIIRPDNASVRLSDIHFDCLQVGNTVGEDVGYGAGDRVFVDRARAIPIILSGNEYSIFSKADVIGREAPAA